MPKDKYIFKFIIFDVSKNLYKTVLQVGTLLERNACWGGVGWSMGQGVLPSKSIGHFWPGARRHESKRTTNIPN